MLIADKYFEYFRFIYPLAAYTLTAVEENKTHMKENA